MMAVRFKCDAYNVAGGVVMVGHLAEGYQKQTAVPVPATAPAAEIDGSTGLEADAAAGAAVSTGLTDGHCLFLLVF